RELALLEGAGAEPAKKRITNLRFSNRYFKVPQLRSSIPEAGCGGFDRGLALANLARRRRTECRDKARRGTGHGAALAEALEHMVARDPSEIEEDERIGLDRLSQEHRQASPVLAGFFFLAVAGDRDGLTFRRCERRPVLPEDRVDFLGEFPGKQSGV